MPFLTPVLVGRGYPYFNLSTGGPSKRSMGPLRSHRSDFGVVCVWVFLRLGIGPTHGPSQTHQRLLDILTEPRMCLKGQFALIHTIPPTKMRGYLEKQFPLRGIPCEVLGVGGLSTCFLAINLKRCQSVSM